MVAYLFFSDFLEPQALAAFGYNQGNRDQRLRLIRVFGFWVEVEVMRPGVWRWTITSLRVVLVSIVPLPDVHKMA